MNIRQRLNGKNSRQRADIKASEIVRLPLSGEHTIAGLKIKIERVSKIEGGIELFARAWKNGKQLGFGKDGTVDLERFRILNPPILVDDPLGMIVDEWVNEKTGTISRRTLREDPVQAIRETLAHTIGIVGKDGKRIKAGKVGNTTSTFFADAGGDGSIYSLGNPFSQARTGANLGASAGGATMEITLNVYTNSDNEMRRMYTPFDTSSIPSGDTISAATVSVYFAAGTTDQLTASMGLVQSNQASLTGLPTSDWTISSYTEYATRKTFASMASAQYYDFAMSSFAPIAKGSGYTKLAFLTGRDIDNSAPSTASDLSSSKQFYAANQATTANDPKIIIEHAASSVEADVTPVLLELTIPDVTATFDIVETASVTPVALELTIPDVTATYIQVEEAAVSPVLLELTIPDVAAGEQHTAEVTPVSLALSIPDVTATSEIVETASVTPVALELSIPDVSATAHVNAEVIPVALELTIPDVTATGVFTAEVTPVLLELTIPDVSPSFELAPIPIVTSSGGFPYALDLFGGADVMETLHSPAINVTGWSKRINAPGKCVFRMNKHHAEATDENLKMWKKITLYRRPRDGTSTMTSVWTGFILAKREVGDYIEVLCAGGLKIFTKRYTGATEAFTGQGSTEAFGLLTDGNTTGATGVSEGTGGVTETLDLELDTVEMLKAFEEIAAATGGEFEVDEEWAFNFVASLGTDKSEIIELIFRRDGQQSNLIEYEIAEDGEPMANRIIGTTTAGGGLTSTYNHPTSTDDYPILVERKAFNQAQDQGTLDALTEAYGLQRGLPIADFRAIPATATKKFNPLTGERELSGLQYEDVSVGDLVLVTVITPNRNQSVIKRVAELIVDVDENLNEQLRFTLTEAGVFVTENYLEDTAFNDVKRRIQEIENQL